MFKNISIIVALLVLLGCFPEQPGQKTSQKTAPAAIETAEQAEGPKTANYLLFFFLNPNGGPCRMQGNILNQMSSELDGKVLIRPVQTTIPEDRDLFYTYGIRALPMILLADSSGKEIKRLPPGVQSAETIRNLLNQIPTD